MPTLTDIATPLDQTAKTDETDAVSNMDFLQGIFGMHVEDHVPLVVSFKGHPAKVHAGAWSAKPWRADMALPSDQNNYFALSTFTPREDGQYSRKKRHFAALHAVMLDDIGNKVDAQRIGLKPSWRIETSPGNFQIGFILSQPLTDAPTADRLMNAIIAAQLCDPGASGPQSRLARLPVAMNGKYNPAFPCRLTEWDPSTRYSVQDLLDGLQLDMRSTARPKKEKAGHTDRSSDNAIDDVLIPMPSHNPVLAALQERNLYKGPLGNGKHDLTCPWVAEHTDGIDGGTAYFEPDDTWPLGGFKCLHSHGNHYHIRDLLQFLAVPASSARMKPTIRLMAGELHRIVDAAERNLASTGRHYQRSGLIVTVTTDPTTRETRIQQVSANTLVRALAGVAVWERFDARAGEWVRCDPPARHASILFESCDYPHLPILNGMTRQPYLRPDGSLCSQAGYDPLTGMFGVFASHDFAVPPAPTREQAETSLAMLNGLLDEFVFASEADRSAALSAMLTAAIRPSLPHAPMFHVRAPQISSGKSYLCELIAALATPQESTPMAFPTSDEECCKLLLAELLRAPAVIVFDNLTGDLIPHKSLCTALTSEYLSGRILGVSKIATVNTRALILSSGNNVGPIADMTRRCVTINLDPGCEIPAARTFKRPDLLRDVTANRTQYVAAALTVIRAYIAAGSPKMPCKSLATYTRWAEWCRQPLLWLQNADPATSVFEGMADDPDREILHRFLTAWHGNFGTKPIMVRDVVKRMDYGGANTEELREVVTDIAGDRDGVNRRKLGRWIKRHAGRIVDGMKLVRIASHSNAESWKIESVIAVSSVSRKEVLQFVTEQESEVF